MAVKYGYEICQKNNLCLGLLANQKVKKVHNINTVSYNKRTKNRNIFKKEV